MGIFSRLFAVVVIFGLITIEALAQSSSNYNLEEFYVGPGGTLDAASASYGLRATLGETGQGESASANYNLLAGFTTDDEPSLGVDVSNTNIDFGVLDEFTTGTGNATFSVLSYNTSGYVVQSFSTPPTNGDYSLDDIDTPSASSAGTEQFGLNLVANTSPVAFGANPIQQPDGSFSFGFAASGYDTANFYKYAEGDVIARSTTSTGYTLFTLSYLANVSSITPGGEYTMKHNLVVTGTF